MLYVCQQVMATHLQSPPETNLSTAIKVHSEADPVPHTQPTQWLEVIVDYHIMKVP